jgi:uncharacterized protein (DUF433 family)
MGITSNPNVSGTRITIESIREGLGAGEPQVQIIETNPRMTAQDVADARRFEAKATQVDAWLVGAVDCKDVKL